LAVGRRRAAEEQSGHGILPWCGESVKARGYARNFHPKPAKIAKAGPAVAEQSRSGILPLYGEPVKAADDAQRAARSGVGRWEMGVGRGRCAEPPRLSRITRMMSWVAPFRAAFGGVGSWQWAGGVRRKSRVATASCRGVGNRAKRVVTRGVFTRSPRRSRRLDRRWRSRVEAASCRFVGNRSKRLMTRSAQRAREMGDGRGEGALRAREMGVGSWELGDGRGRCAEPPRISRITRMMSWVAPFRAAFGGVGSWQWAGGVRRKSRVATASCRGVGNQAKRVVTRGVFTRSPRRSRRLDRRWRSRVEAASCRFMGNRSKRLMTRSALRAREMGDGRGEGHAVLNHPESHESRE
jgi:hypothetical protein